jgi:MinD-like ATPase involved in chromosome partitioning or flagellar assembly
MAELMTDRDLTQLFQLLRRMYQAVVIDTAPILAGTTLAMLDAADAIVQVVTIDAATVDSTRVASATFAQIGYAPKLRLLVNRVESAAGFRPDRLARTLGKKPDYTIRSDWQLVAGSNAEGTPFVLAKPESPASVDIRSVAAHLLTVEAARSVPGRKRVRRN